jgi:hypothetical protein
LGEKKEKKRCNRTRRRMRCGWFSFFLFLEPIVSRISTWIVPCLPTWSWYWVSSSNKDQWKWRKPWRLCHETEIIFSKSDVCTSHKFELFL